MQEDSNLYVYNYCNILHQCLGGEPYIRKHTTTVDVTKSQWDNMSFLGLLTQYGAYYQYSNIKITPKPPPPPPPLRFGVEV
tara:strand:+ start:1220 stop:1462 length:243 start_codon:yes stop_codon:yes gene_type:complete